MHEWKTFTGNKKVCTDIVTTMIEDGPFSQALIIRIEIYAMIITPMIEAGPFSWALNQEKGNIGNDSHINDRGRTLLLGQ